MDQNTLNQNQVNIQNNENVIDNNNNNYNNNYNNNQQYEDDNYNYKGWLVSDHFWKRILAFIGYLLLVQIILLPIFIICSILFSFFVFGYPINF